jgi:hypothetical protein
MKKKVVIKHIFLQSKKKLFIKLVVVNSPKVGRKLKKFSYETIFLGFKLPRSKNSSCCVDFHPQSQYLAK